MQGRKSNKGVSSTEYVTEDTCGLFSEEHAIPENIAIVLNRLDEKFGDDIGVVAGGCGSCTIVEEPLGVFYIAQDAGLHEHLMLKYDADGDAPLTRNELGEVICKVAEECGADWSWNGSTRKCICLGKNDHYDDEYEL